MVRILFVCHGNICRSPMGACVFADMARRRGLSDKYDVDSAATSLEEIGNGMYPPAERKLREKDVPRIPHRAVRMTPADYKKYDLLIGMDSANIRNMARIAGGDPEGKIRRLLDYTGRPRDVADPWYTDDFETAYRDIQEGCAALLDALERA
ncbi:MAG: low molecular weight phosphotyrosine protein phosphatase [Oscillospiraceae bacterium]|nr:low molecular weight phosphotyrosine protein phosphatase [Oscillospiraceae bacterium]